MVVVIGVIIVIAVVVVAGAVFVVVNAAGADSIADCFVVFAVFGTAMMMMIIVVVVPTAIGAAGGCRGFSKIRGSKPKVADGATVFRGWGWGRSRGVPRVGRWTGWSHCVSVCVCLASPLVPGKTTHACRAGPCGRPVHSLARCLEQKCFTKPNA